MLTHRPFTALGRFRNEWLDANYHFSFANYYDPAQTGVGPLLVWNDDTIAPHRGFAPHGHADMEIVTVMRGGVLTHTDSVGNVGQLRAGEIQTMSAGRGITHSEMNKDADPATLFQIWIEPRHLATAPRWASRGFVWPHAGGLTPLASGQGHDAALEIDQDATLFAGQPGPDGLSHDFAAGRRFYLVALDPVTINGLDLAARDGVAGLRGGSLRITAPAGSAGRFVLADLP